MNKIILSTISFLCFLTVGAQNNAAPNDVFLGKWIAKDTGIYITATAIQLLYKNDKQWQVSNWDHERVTFLDSAVTNTKKIFTACGEMNSFIRAYLKEGGEEMTYFSKFCIYKPELLNTNTLRLSKSKAIRIVSENDRIPSIVTHKMKEDLAKNRWLLSEMRWLWV